MQCINSVECRRQSAEFQFKRTAALIPQKFTVTAQGLSSYNRHHKVLNEFNKSHICKMGNPLGSAASLVEELAINDGLRMLACEEMRN